MDLNLVLNFVRPELLILVIFIWCLGLFFKKMPLFNKEWIIPFILLGFSVIITVLYISFVLGEGFSPSSIVSAIIQGVIIAALAVFSNEIIKQLTIKRRDDNRKIGIYDK